MNKNFFDFFSDTRQCGDFMFCRVVRFGLETRIVGF
jgi:hypothetical protein